MKTIEMKTMTRVAMIWILGCAASYATPPDSAAPGMDGAATVEVLQLRIHRCADRNAAGFPRGTHLIESQADFEALARMPLPAGVDFSKVRLAVISQPLSGSADRLEVGMVERGPDGYRIAYGVTRGAAVGTAQIVYDVCLVEIPRDGLTVRFERTR